MSTTRRHFLARAAGAVAAAGLLPWRAAAAQPAWPAKPVKLINMGPPGSPPDTYARIYAARLAQALGVPVVVDNRPGAGANLASDAVAKAAPDGYTLLYTVSSAFTINPFLYRKLPFDPDDRQIPIADARRQYEGAINSPKRELKIFTSREGGVEHCSADNQANATDYIADWVAETFAELGAPEMRT